MMPCPVEAMPRSAVLTPVDQARERLLAGLAPLCAQEARLANAGGAVLAADIVPARPLPHTAVARVRGFAVSAAEIVGASSYSPAMLPTIPVFVEAGEALPSEADAILPADAVQPRPGYAEITVAAIPGEGVRRAGEDAAAGVPLVKAGTILSSLDLAIAAAAGVREVAIRRARLAVIAPPDDPLGLFLTEAGQSAGAEVITSTIDHDLTAADLVVAVARTGTVPDQSLSWGLALRPGEETGFGIVRDQPVVVLPPRLEAALAVWLLLIRPCLDCLQGARPARPWRRARLTRKISSTVGLTELALVREVAAGLEPLGIADLTLTALARAEGWIALPPESEGFQAGTEVDAFAL